MIFVSLGIISFFTVVLYCKACKDVFVFEMTYTGYPSIHFLEPFSGLGGL